MHIALDTVSQCFVWLICDEQLRTDWDQNAVCFRMPSCSSVLRNLLTLTLLHLDMYYHNAAPCFRQQQTISAMVDTALA